MRGQWSNDHGRRQMSVPPSPARPPLQMCTPDMTMATGTGMPPVDGELTARHVSRGAVAGPFVRMLSGPAAVVFSERQVARPGGDGEEGAGGELVTLQESRVWEVHEGRWKCVHCHESSEAPL
ncbi:unnamed protein product [Sphacelaria rigidula]